MQLIWPKPQPNHTMTSTRSRLIIFLLFSDIPCRPSSPIVRWFMSTCLWRRICASSLAISTLIGSFKAKVNCDTIKSRNFFLMNFNDSSAARDRVEKLYKCLKEFSKFNLNFYFPFSSWITIRKSIESTLTCLPVWEKIFTLFPFNSNDKLKWKWKNGRKVAHNN